MTLQDVGSLVPMNFSAADARARGEEVPDDVPDCAEAWCEGWTTEVKPSEYGFSATMTAIRPFWRWVTITGTFETEAR